MSDETFSVYYALDGIHLDGLIGSAGLLRFDWPERRVQVEHFFGVSAAHNPSLSPDGRLALVGNFGQQILLVDVSRRDAMVEVARQSTQFFEDCGYRLRANTHHVWHDDNERFIGAIGDNLYRFHVDDLKAPEKLGPHRLENAHELRWDSTKRWILIGDLGPERRDVRQIAVFDLAETDPEKRSRVIRVQNNVWHCAVHPSRPVGYALTYSLVTDNDDYVNWSPGYVREYVYEVDLPSACITRTWNAGAEFPAHLNSDVECTEEHLYVACGGSHTVVEIALDDLTTTRVFQCLPGKWVRARSWRQRWKNILGGLARRPSATSTHFVLQTMQVSGWRFQDGIYAARVSPGGQYLITGNRGYNELAVYDRQTMKKVYSTLLPFRRDRYDGSPEYRLGRTGFHLGVHHSELVGR